MKPDLFVVPELAWAVHRSKGFVLPSMNQGTQLVNSVLHRINIFKGFNENKLFSNVIFSNVSVFRAV